MPKYGIMNPSNQGDKPYEQRANQSDILKNWHDIQRVILFHTQIFCLGTCFHLMGVEKERTC